MGPPKTKGLQPTPVVPAGSGLGEILNSPVLTRVPIRKNHFGTYFYKDVSELDPIYEICKKWAYKGMIQTEICPTTKNKHLHVMMWCDKKCRDTQFGLPKEFHWEKMKDEDNKSNYANKDKSFDGVFRKRWGFRDVRILENLFPWQQDIENIYLSEPDPRKIYWFWEDRGGVGKSAFVKYMVVKHKALFCDGGKKSDLINLVFNNDMDRCKAVIWDLPRATKGSISYATLESIKNGLICNTKYETGVKAFDPPHIFVFANYEPEEIDKLSADRWIIKKL